MTPCEHSDHLYRVTRQRCQRRDSRISFVTIREIAIAVAKEFGLTPSELISECKAPQAVLARHVTMYVAKKVTPYGYPRIGRYLGDRNNSTVRAALRRFDRKLEASPALAEQVHRLVETMSAEVTA